MDVDIPYDRWHPLSVYQVVKIFLNTPFKWCLAGGYAVEQFLGSSHRPHSDIDIVLYRDEQLSLQRWLHSWQFFAADPPGTLRQWKENEYLPFGIHDIWGHETGSATWQLQIMLAEVEGDQWFSRRNSGIRGKREDLISVYNGVPCVRIEVQLMYKSQAQRPKDDLDFHTCLPLMSIESKQWLREALLLLYPQGHNWLDSLP